MDNIPFPYLEEESRVCQKALGRFWHENINNNQQFSSMGRRTVRSRCEGWFVVMVLFERQLLKEEQR
jgi:hypothetical protein